MAIGLDAAGHHERGVSCGALRPYPTERLWQAIMNILSYLNGTKSFGITYVRGLGLALQVNVDPDYADKANERRSVSGIAVTSGGTVVSPASRKHNVSSFLTSEAAYIAAGDGVKEALFCLPFCLSLHPR